MEVLVLICAVFLLMLSSSTTSDTNRNSETYTLVNATNLAKPGCESRCGDLIVPYPFGIGNNTNCSIGRGFDIYCNTSVEPPKASFTETDPLSFKRISDSTLRVSNLVAKTCYFRNGTVSNTPRRISLNFTNDWPYTISEVNKFTVIGCSDYAWLTLKTKSKNVSTGCMVFCSKLENVVGDQCSGNGCCESSIPQDMSYYTTRPRSLQNSTDINQTRSFNPCTYAFVGEENKFKFKGAADLNDTSFMDRIEANVPVVLEWAIGNLSCPEAQARDGFALTFS